MIGQEWSTEGQLRGGNEKDGKEEVQEDPSRQGRAGQAGKGYNNRL